MTSADWLLIAYCATVVLASLAGGWLPSLVRLTHTRLQMMMSAVSGLMLGVAVLHMLPHGVEYLGGSVVAAAAWMLVGILTMFFLIRAFHFHQHGLAEEGGHADHDCDHDHDHPGHTHHVHDHAQHDHSHSASGSHRWIGLFAGLSLHTAIDGVALAASVSVESEHDAAFPLLGLGTFLAILLHKPLDALSITSVMAAGHWPSRARTLVNAGFALMCPLGALILRLSLFGWGGGGETLVGAALAFSAGVFLCISLGDLLPELQFHSHDRLKLSAALLLGVAIAIGIEMTHSHAHGEHGAHEDHGHAEPKHGEPGHEEHDHADTAGDRHGQ